jgi:hypothetical protein
MNNDRPVDTWGPYRAAIEDHLASCADYLDRLQRSLAGEIAPDRHYFRSKAHQLELVTRSLVRRAQDIEGWLDACDSPVVRNEPGASHATCELPRGHRGVHDDNPPSTAAEQARDAARDLSDLAAGASHDLGSLTPVVDRSHTAVDNRVTPDDCDVLHELSKTLERISQDARRLATHTRQLEVGGPDHDTVSASPVTDQQSGQSGASCCDPGVGL